MAEAKNFVLGAISICTEHVLSQACLGRIYHAEGYLKMAEKMFRLFQKIIKIFLTFCRDASSNEPFDCRNWHQLGCVLSELDRNDEALECFQMAASLEVNTLYIYIKLLIN